MKTTPETLARKHDLAKQPDSTASAIDRLRYLVTIMHKTQADFARLIGVDPSNLSKLLLGHSRLTPRFIDRIVHNTGVSREWLINGTDVPFPRSIDSQATIPVDITTLDKNLTAIGAPVYDIDVTAGCRELSRMFTNARIIGRLEMPGLDPVNPIVKASGDSMTPRIPEGSFIQIRSIPLDSPIFWGSTYVVITDDYRMLKVIRRHANPDMVILHSYNPQFDDMELYRRDIVALYIVESVMTYDTLS